MPVDVETVPSPAPQMGMRLSATGVTDEDDDYSASMTAILHRRGSTRKLGLGKRRTSSPLDSDRRRSSVFTTSSGETAITMDGENGPASQEAIFENIRLHKEVLESVKQQPWEMRRKLKLVQQAKEYVRRHEGQLQERLAQSKSTRDVMARFNILILRYWQYIKREAANMAIVLTPWEMRIKEIESHFGSVVASYFTFLRWVFWINIVITAIIVCLVIVPEVVAADPLQAGTRKDLLKSEERTSTHLSTLWDFEGVFKYSPMFYGFYTNQAKTKEGFPLPLSYFLTGLGVYVYSFVAILRRMAKNSRQSKLSEKEDECIFSWKLFTGWDYMIGNPETAFNRFASITMGFKEALLEEKEKKKDERNWKIIGLRVLANILVLMLLASSALAVIKVVERSDEIKDKKGAGWLRENEITLVMSMITNIFPNIFELIGMLEKYHPRRQLRWQLARIMSLNFLNLYTLIIALFGTVSKMTVDLESLRPNQTEMPMTMPSHFEVCGNVSVDCTKLEEYHFTQNVKQTKDILTLLTTAALITKYVTNSSAPSLPMFNKTIGGISATLDQRELQDLIQLLSPKMDLAEYATRSPELTKLHAEIDDNEFVLLNDSDQIARKLADLRPVDESTLKAALPLILKLFYSLIPDRVYTPNTTPSTFYNYTMGHGNVTTPTLADDGNETSSSSTWSSPSTYYSEDPTSTDSLYSSSSSSSRGYTEVETKRPYTFGTRRPFFKGYSEFQNKGRPYTIGTRQTETQSTPYTPRPARRLYRGRYRGVREAPTEESETSPPDEDYEYTGSNNLVLTGHNSYQFGSAKSTTRGDIPGHITETEVPSTTISPPEDNSDKLLTDIFLVIQMMVTQNSSKTDYAQLSTIDKLAEFVTNYHYHAETRRAPSYPYNTTVSAKFHRKSKEFDAKQCYIYACENGTVAPPAIIEFLNCSDMYCALSRLVGNDTTCYIPGSASCMTTEAPVTPTVDPAVSQRLSRLCWETMFGQELVKLTVMDLIFTVGMILVQDFIRAVLVRLLNPCWCWDLEKKFPQYGDFKIAENILHLVNNQGMVWMGMFFSPGLPAINLIKLVILMYIRSWTVMTCNVPHETVFRASRSNNFYFALLLFMLFLCTLPVGYAIVRLKPSWHCGPFSDHARIYKIFTDALMAAMPESTHDAILYTASPGIVIPLLVLLVLIIYYLLSLTSSLRESNNDLKSQLRRERTEERRKMFKMAGGKNEKETPFTRWNALMPVVKSVAKPGAEKPPSVLTTGKQTGFAGLAKRAALKAKEKPEQQDDGNATDVDQMSLPEDIVALPKTKAVIQKAPAGRKPSCTDSLASIRSEIPVIKISKEDDPIGQRKEKIEGTAVPTKPTPGPSSGTGPEQNTAEPTKKARVLRALIDKSKQESDGNP